MIIGRYLSKAGYEMKNYADRTKCSVSVDYRLRDLRDFSYQTKAEFNNVVSLLIQKMGWSS